MLANFEMKAKERHTTNSLHHHRYVFARCIGAHSACAHCTELCNSNPSNN